MLFLNFSYYFLILKLMVQIVPRFSLKTSATEIHCLMHFLIAKMAANTIPKMDQTCCLMMSLCQQQIKSILQQDSVILSYNLINWDYKIEQWTLSFENRTHWLIELHWNDGHFITAFMQIPKMAERRGQQNACVWQTWQGY